MADGDEKGRRAALRTLITAGSAAFGCALAAPALVFVAGPLETKGGARERWIRTVKLEALHEGDPKKVAIVADQRDAWMLTKNVELGAAWLIRRGDKVTALSAMCPHLGCSVNADAAATFSCPCHASAFDADGKRTSGPSPRDLDALPTRIEDGFVVVDFRSYRTGTADQVETG
jgi:cytochrome b6-f complex iron-sulfur subunit/menaquinol-cytochrome c reductase iron-sulfur subunit